MQSTIQNFVINNMSPLKCQFRTGSGNSNGKRKVSSIRLLLVAGRWSVSDAMRPKLVNRRDLGI